MTCGQDRQALWQTLKQMDNPFLVLRTVHAAALVLRAVHPVLCLPEAAAL